MQDRLDVLSLLIMGPEDTPYEGNMFVFDVQLHADYPHHPPTCYYHNRCEGRLNPNLYEDGKV